MSAAEPVTKPRTNTSVPQNYQLYATVINLTWQTMQRSCPTERKTAAPFAAGLPRGRPLEKLYSLQSRGSRQARAAQRPSTHQLQCRRSWNTSVQHKSDI